MAEDYSGSQDISAGYEENAGGYGGAEESSGYHDTPAYPSPPPAKPLSREEQLVRGLKGPPAGMGTAPPPTSAGQEGSGVDNLTVASPRKPYIPPGAMGIPGLTSGAPPPSGSRIGGPAGGGSRIGGPAGGGSRIGGPAGAKGSRIGGPSSGSRIGGHAIVRSNSSSPAVPSATPRVGAEGGTKGGSVIEGRPMPPAARK
eukprot:TRINITY_DN15713_c0_g1_i1.p1 TRINITY_DN15713_c0_g1~~TRINITY_DN15713_c0_g1_i1.p1  ORF type:complete len:211 (-),score=40.05 TRINITY_DN15713_c0_g1_i1:24-623(-)